jgi:hypothetical protein
MATFHVDVLGYWEKNTQQYVPLDASPDQDEDSNDDDVAMEEEGEEELEE